MPEKVTSVPVIIFFQIITETEWAGYHIYWEHRKPELLYKGYFGTDIDDSFASFCQWTEALNSIISIAYNMLLLCSVLLCFSLAAGDYIK